MPVPLDAARWHRSGVARWITAPLTTAVTGAPTDSMRRRGAGYPSRISRAELYTALCAMGLANGFAGPMVAAVARQGLATAVYQSFGISAFSWIALLVSCSLLRTGPREPVSRMDLAVALCVSGACMVPASTLSWIALTLLAVRLLIVDADRGPASAPLPALRRAAWVILATANTMCWVPHVLDATDRPLKFDAALVGWIAGMPHVGNTVPFANGDGFIWIEPGCSSFMNASVAFLCWVLFAQARGLGWSIRRIGWCTLACGAVIAINLVRLTTIVLLPGSFAVIHDPGSWGAMAVNWLSALAAVAICAWGTRDVRRIAG